MTIIIIIPGQVSPWFKKYSNNFKIYFHLSQF